MENLAFSITLHDKMPDVVLYSAEKNWLYSNKAVTSVGPMEPKRIKEIEEMTQNGYCMEDICDCFPGFKDV